MIEIAEEHTATGKYKRILASCLADVATDPCNAKAHYRLARWQHALAMYAEALENYTRAVELDPLLSDAIRDRADLYACCPDECFRNGALALREAVRALQIAKAQHHLDSDWRHRSFLLVIAAAYANVDAFDAAIETLAQAMHVSTTRVAGGRVQALMDQFAARVPLRSEERLG
jgi:tetratricopeptide (TPR) repeat protein